MSLMILPAILFAVLLFFTATLLSGERSLAYFFDIPALACIVVPLLCYPLYNGFKPFAVGLAAIVQPPRKPQDDIADYWQKLLLTLGTIESTLAIALAGLSLHLSFPLAIRQQFLSTANLIFFYIGWFTLLICLPIISRFAEGIWKPTLRYTLIAGSLLGIVLIACIILSVYFNEMQIHLREIPAALAQQYDGWFSAESFLPILWDTPSFLVIVFTLFACRLAWGKLPNRFDWLRASIPIGIIWTLHSFVIIRMDFVPEYFASSSIVALLTTLYSLLFALSVLVNWSWFFTIIFPFQFLLQIGIQSQNEGIEGIPSSPAACGLLFGIILLSGFFGRFFDMCYLMVTRYESFRDLFRKHILWWFLLIVLALPGLFALTAFIIRN